MRSTRSIEILCLALAALVLVWSRAIVVETWPVVGSLAAFIAAIVVFRARNFFPGRTRTRLMIESWSMVVFITAVLWFTGKSGSPLLNLYLLPIIASALILGKVMTFVEMVAIALCFMALHYDPKTRSLASVAYWGELLALLAPVILVAYITTMLSADIRYAVDKIKRVSDTDDLTGLYNMRAFSAILHRAFKQSVRHAHTLSIVMIDCDNLKTVNDTHGHEAGNRLLQHAVRCIREELRGSDVLARFGGDEFIALLPETESRGAREMGERIRRAIEGTNMDVRGGEIHTTVSVGVASYPLDGGSLEVIIDKADRAMYKAKQQGRNKVVAASEE